MTSQAFNVAIRLAALALTGVLVSAASAGGFKIPDQSSRAMGMERGAGHEEDDEDARAGAESDAAAQDPGCRRRIRPARIAAAHPDTSL